MAERHRRRQVLPGAARRRGSSALRPPRARSVDTANRSGLFCITSGTGHDATPAKRRYTPPCGVFCRRPPTECTACCGVFRPWPRTFRALPHLYGPVAALAQRQQMAEPEPTGLLHSGRIVEFLLEAYPTSVVLRHHVASGIHSMNYQGSAASCCLGVFVAVCPPTTSAATDLEPHMPPRLMGGFADPSGSHAHRFRRPNRRLRRRPPQWLRRPHGRVP